MKQKDNMNQGIKAQSMIQSDRESRNSKTGYKGRGNTALEPGIINTKGKK